MITCKEYSCFLTRIKYFMLEVQITVLRLRQKQRARSTQVRETNTKYAREGNPRRAEQLKMHRRRKIIFYQKRKPNAAIHIPRVFFARQKEYQSLDFSLYLQLFFQFSLEKFIIVQDLKSGWSILVSISVRYSWEYKTKKFLGFANLVKNDSFSRAEVCMKQFPTKG